MRRAFTLMELVVVFVIVGIVAAILFPILASPQHKRDFCLSHAKQLGVGLMMYAQDYDEKLPQAEKWMTLAYPYVKNRETYHCTKLSQELPKTTPSFAMDVRLSGKNFVKLPEPGTRALVYDSTRTDWDATDPAQSFATRHFDNKRGSLIYADGHAKQVTAEVFAQAATPSP